MPVIMLKQVISIRSALFIFLMIAVPWQKTFSKHLMKTLLKPGKPFDLDVIKAERTRIDGLLKEKGFYFFSPEYLLVKTDSTIGNHLVDLYVTS